MTVIEAVEKDHYNLESVNKSLLLGLLKRAYNEGLAEGELSTQSKLHKVFRLVFEEENNDA